MGQAQILIIGIVFLVAVGGLLLLIFTLSDGKKSTKGRKNVQSARDLGFAPVTSPDPALTERIIALHERGYHQILEIHNLFRQKHPDCMLYLYDIWDVSDSENDLVVKSAIALSSSALDLPRLLVYPKVNVVGWTGDMSNQFVEKLIGLHSQVIEFNNHPSFNKRYFVTSDDEISVRRYLSGSVLAALTQTQLDGLALIAREDIMVVMEINAESTQEKDPNISLRAKRDMALMLYERLL